MALRFSEQQVSSTLRSQRLARAQQLGYRRQQTLLVQKERLLRQQWMRSYTKVVNYFNEMAKKAKSQGKDQTLQLTNRELLLVLSIQLSKRFIPQFKGQVGPLIEVLVQAELAAGNKQLKAMTDLMAVLGLSNVKVQNGRLDLAQEKVHQLSFKKLNSIVNSVVDSEGKLQLQPLYQQIVDKTQWPESQQKKLKDVFDSIEYKFHEFQKQFLNANVDFDPEKIGWYSMATLVIGVALLALTVASLGTASLAVMSVLSIASSVLAIVNSVSEMTYLKDYGVNRGGILDRSPILGSLQTGLSLVTGLSAFSRASYVILKSHRRLLPLLKNSRVRSLMRGRGVIAVAGRRVPFVTSARGKKNIWLDRAGKGLNLAAGGFKWADVVERSRITGEFDSKRAFEAMLKVGTTLNPVKYVDALAEVASGMMDLRDFANSLKD